MMGSWVLSVLVMRLVSHPSIHCSFCFCLDFLCCLFVGFETGSILVTLVTSILVTSILVTLVSNSFSGIPRGGTVGPCEIPVLNLLKNCQMVFQSIPSGSVWGLQFANTSYFLFYSNHPGGCEMVWTHISLMASNVEQLFMFLLAIFYIVFEEVSLPILCPAFN